MHAIVIVVSHFIQHDFDIILQVCEDYSSRILTNTCDCLLEYEPAETTDTHHEEVTFLRQKHTSRVLLRSLLSSFHGLCVSLLSFCPILGDPVVHATQRLVEMRIFASSILLGDKLRCWNSCTVQVCKCYVSVWCELSWVHTWVYIYIIYTGFFRER